MPCNGIHQGIVFVCVKDSVPTIVSDWLDAGFAAFVWIQSFCSEASIPPDSNGPMLNHEISCHTFQIQKCSQDWTLKIRRDEKMDLRAPWSLTGVTMLFSQ